MIQGIRNSRVPKYTFKHNDVNDLEEKLSKVIWFVWYFIPQASSEQVPAAFLYYYY